MMANIITDMNLLFTPFLTVIGTLVRLITQISQVLDFMQANVMVCVKLDMNYGYFFVASVFEITTAKLEGWL